MSRHDTIGKVATTILIGPGKAIKVQYHKTIVWERNESGSAIILRTGGWKTATTKHRMNQAFRQFGYPFGVSQCDGKWYINNYEQAPHNGVRYSRFDGDVYTIELEVQS